MATALRKPYRLKPADKPLHEHFKRLFYAHEILGWSVKSHDEWYYEVADGEFKIYDFEEVKELLRQLDPAGCDWDVPATKPKSTPRAELVKLLTRAAAAVASVDPELAAEAQRALEAA